MDLSVEFQDTTFRVTTHAFFFEWVDTPENRQVAVVVLRCLRDEAGQPLFTLQQVAQIVESDHRQAVGCHVDTFRAGGMSSRR
ncbi:MAG: hypothetical protein HY709_12050 [Candidatus Latescibacteria bacterium]|nr:hypothetical protein [Candidatus Latescibacterota bacterium]